MTSRIPVYVETGAKRVFASALEWPGWSRGARNEQDALRSLAGHGPRYAKVARAAKLAFAVPDDVAAFRIVQRLAGGSGTDFGVPTLGPRSDDRPLGSEELARLVALLEAGWDEFDRIARSARGVELRKGPRGGGRDLDKIVTHVVEAEEAYLGQLGARSPKGEGAAKALALRGAILDTLDARAQGRPLAEPTRVKKKWTPKYFVRRAAWHVLDHAWEIEDRA